MVAHAVCIIADSDGSVSRWAPGGARVVLTFESGDLNLCKDMLDLVAQTGGNQAQQWIAIAAGVAGLAYLLLRQRRGRKQDPLESVPRMSLARQRSLEREMNNLVVELSEMARQITAQLDTRATKLELLMKEADRKIAELQRLAGAIPPQSGMSSPGGEPLSADLPGDSAPADPSTDLRHADVYALADAGHTPQEIAQKLDRPSGEIELILALRSSAGRR